MSITAHQSATLGATSLPNFLKLLSSFSYKTPELQVPTKQISHYAPIAHFGFKFCYLKYDVIKSTEICEISVIDITVRPEIFPVSGNSTVVYLSQHLLGFKTIVKQAGTACEWATLPNRWLHIKAAKRPCMSIVCLWGHEL